MYFGRVNVEIGWKMAKCWLLFLALIHDNWYKHINELLGCDHYLGSRQWEAMAKPTRREIETQAKKMLAQGMEYAVCK